jgi:hypothetical protein
MSIPVYTLGIVRGGLEACERNEPIFPLDEECVSDIDQDIINAKGYTAQYAIQLLLQGSVGEEIEGCEMRLIQLVSNIKMLECYIPKECNGGQENIEQCLSKKDVKKIISNIKTLMK